MENYNDIHIESFNPAAEPHSRWTCAMHLVTDDGVTMGFGDVIPDTVVKLDVVYCANCGQIGHLKRDCSTDRCRLCDQLGHKKVDCPAQTCNSCGATGHLARDCPDKHLKKQCFHCKQVGHLKSVCSNAELLRCGNCDEDGHETSDCPEICSSCGNAGHTVSDCKNISGGLWKAFIPGPPVPLTAEHRPKNTTDPPHISVQTPDLAGTQTVEANSKDVTHIDDHHLDPSANVIPEVPSFWEEANEAWKDAGVLCGLRFVYNDDHCTFIHLDINVYWADGNGRVVRVPQSLRLTTDNVSQMQVHYIDAGDIANHWSDMFPDSPHTWTEDHQYVKFSLRYDVRDRALLQGTNLFIDRVGSEVNTSMFSMALAAKMSTLSASLAKSGARFRFLFRASHDLFRHVYARWSESLSKQASRDPLQAWARSEKGIVIQKGMWRELGDRPVYSKPLPVKASFFSVKEYATIFFMNAAYNIEQTLARPPQHDVHLRFVRMNPTNENLFFATLANVRAAEGETLLIQFGDDDPTTLWWRAIVTKRFPYVPASDTAVFLTRPWVQERDGSGDWSDLNIPDNRIIDPIGKSVEQLREAIFEGVPTSITVNSIKPVKQEYRHITRLTHFFKNHTRMPVVTRMLMANDLIDLPFVSLYRTDAAVIGQLIVDKARSRVHQLANNSQTIALQALDSMSGGMAIWHAPGGSGKTFAIVLTTMYCFLTSTKANLGPVHVLSSANKALDGVIVKCAQYLSNLWIDGTIRKDFPHLRYPIVVRKHMHDSELDITYKEAHDKQRQKSGRPGALQIDADFAELAVHANILQAYRKLMLPRTGTFDTRVQAVDLAEGTWILRLAGLRDANGDKHPVALDTTEFECVGAFNELFHRFRQGEVLEESENIALTQARNEIAIILKREAIVIGETYQNFLEGRSHRDVCPRIVMMDENAKAPEMDSSAAWISVQPYVIEQGKPVFNNPLVPCVLVGDVFQPRPPMIHDQGSQTSPNPFTRYQQLSLMARMIEAGMRVVYFSEQMRSVTEINDLQRVIGGPATTTHPSAENRPEAARANAVFADMFRNPLRLHLIDVVDSNQGIQETSRSRFNKVHAEIAVSLACKLMTRYNIKPDQIAIMTPYTAQISSLLATREAAKGFFMANHRQDRRAFTNSIDQVNITTVDGLHGLEADYVILDIPNTDGPGFLKDAARVRLAVGRPRVGLIIVANYGMLAKTVRFENTMLGRVLNHCKMLHVSTKVRPSMKNWYCPFDVPEHAVRAQYLRVPGIESLPLSVPDLQTDHRRYSTTTQSTMGTQQRRIRTFHSGLPTTPIISNRSP